MSLCDDVISRKQWTWYRHRLGLPLAGCQEERGSLVLRRLGGWSLRGPPKAGGEAGGTEGQARSSCSRRLLPSSLSLGAGSRGLSANPFESRLQAKFEGKGFYEVS